MADILDRKQAIEIYMIDNEYKYYHAGYCKVLVDLVAQSLIIKNYDIDILKFQATFDWHFVQKHNILLAFAPNSCDKFILIFKDVNICDQIYGIIANNKLTQLDDPETLLEQRFLVPVLETIQTHKDRAPFLQQLLTEFVEVLELPEKEMYINFLRANNFYHDVYPQSATTATATVAAQQHDIIDLARSSAESSSADGIKDEPSTFTSYGDGNEFNWSRAGSPTSALVMNVVDAVSGVIGNGHNEGYDEDMDGYGSVASTYAAAGLPYFNGSSRYQQPKRSTSRSLSTISKPSTSTAAAKRKSYAGSIDNILSGRKTQIKRYKSYLEKLTGPNLTAEEKRKREEYLKCLAVVRITLVKARLQRDLNTFVKRSFGNEMREQLSQSNFTYEMAQEILRKKENPRAQRQLWIAFNETLKNNKAFWERVIRSKDEWNKAFNPDIKLNTYLYEQESGITV